MIAGSASTGDPGTTGGLSPARRRADFTWALGTGNRYSMPRRGPPVILTGGRSPTASARAPMRRRGSRTRSTGRLRSDSSRDRLEGLFRPPAGSEPCQRHNCGERDPEKGASVHGCDSSLRARYTDGADENKMS